MKVFHCVYPKVTNTVTKNLSMYYCFTLEIFEKVKGSFYAKKLKLCVCSYSSLDCHSLLSSKKLVHRHYSHELSCGTFDIFLWQFLGTRLIPRLTSHQGKWVPMKICMWQPCLLLSLVSSLYCCDYWTVLTPQYFTVPDNMCFISHCLLFYVRWGGNRSSCFF